MDKRFYGLLPDVENFLFHIAVDQEVPVLLGFQLVVEVATSALPAPYGWIPWGHTKQKGRTHEDSDYGSRRVSWNAVGPGRLKSTAVDELRPEPARID